MKKVLFGIFAHPDDEAFGPSASLYKAAQAGVDVHLIVVTNGEKGSNPDNHSDLGAARLKEWQKSSQLIGAKSIKALHYPDGGLCTDNYIPIATEVLGHIKSTLKQYTEDTEVDFMTFDYQGISGHLDHIAVSMISTYVFIQLQKNSPKGIFMQNLKYYCLSETLAPSADTSWIYMPAGKHHAQIDEEVPYKEISNKKLEIMRAHHSQRIDCESILSKRKELSEHDKYCDHFHYYR